ncbi:hypothetical protein PJP07_30310, partial [Mycobacterium kansasii]
GWYWKGLDVESRESPGDPNRVGDRIPIPWILSQSTDNTIITFKSLLIHPNPFKFAGDAFGSWDWKEWEGLILDWPGVPNDLGIAIPWS